MHSCRLPLAACRLPLRWTVRRCFCRIDHGGGGLNFSLFKKVSAFILLGLFSLSGTANAEETLVPNHHCRIHITPVSLGANPLHSIKCCGSLQNAVAMNASRFATEWSTNKAVISSAHEQLFLPIFHKDFWQKLAISENIFIFCVTKLQFDGLPNVICLDSITFDNVCRAIFRDCPATNQICPLEF